MIPKYDFQMGQPDPLLTGDNFNPNSYINNIDEQINRLNALKSQFSKSYINPQTQVQQQQPKDDIWNKIDTEVSSLTDEQRKILSSDNTYLAIEQELQFLIQQELVNSVKYKVGDTPRGKELLNNQLSYIRTKKKEIIEKANAETELFKQFKIATQANPNLTYAEFIKSIKK